MLFLHVKHGRLASSFANRCRPFFVVPAEEQWMCWTEAARLLSRGSRGEPCGRFVRNGDVRGPRDWPNEPEKLVVTSATLVVTSALLVVTRSYYV